MVDFSFFRRPTYLGANIAQFTFAAGLLTMLTFMPIYFQHALGLSPRAAGLAMLPLALPLFIVPRIVTSQLSHRVSGRVLLTAGLGLVSAGLGFVALVAGQLDYHLMLAGMLVAGIGAGLLNGETTKVGMTVIPAERAGMASGISGTMRFTGIVLGFAALGVVLFSRISAVVTAALPALDDSARSGLIRDVASGDLSGSGIASASEHAAPCACAEKFCRRLRDAVCGERGVVPDRRDPVLAAGSGVRHPADRQKAARPFKHACRFTGHGREKPELDRQRNSNLEPLLAHGGIFAEIARRSLEHDPAVAHDVEPGLRSSARWRASVRPAAPRRRAARSRPAIRRPARPASAPAPRWARRSASDRDRPSRCGTSSASAARRPTTRRRRCPAAPSGSETALKTSSKFQRPNLPERLRPSSRFCRTVSVGKIWRSSGT